MTKSINHFQQSGVAWDIIAEAIESYREYMLNDDYDAAGKLREIIERMDDRRNLYRKAPTP